MPLSLLLFRFRLGYACMHSPSLPSVSGETCYAYAYMPYFSSSSSPPISCLVCCIRRLHSPSTATMLLSGDGDVMPPPSVFDRLLLSFSAAAIQIFRPMMMRSRGNIFSRGKPLKNCSMFNFRSAFPCYSTSFFLSFLGSQVIHFRRQLALCVCQEETDRMT